MEKLEAYQYINKTKTIKEIARGDMIQKINELMKEYGEIKRRLDNHISKHKEYEGGGRPAPK
ncbi:hypothetical protein LCGC14_1921700 [marine sediment metagenome]|uniref:Uncharacterized protein n=1 Tax=marine sediment metagenome TaxID=412755 RepID=A0A0F9FQG3_9ZZZZ|nr:hypothetical protein [Candidatus Scalindua sp.]